MNKDYYRHSIRLGGYDYGGEGWYFITLCAKDRIKYFGEIINGQMRLSRIGEIVCSEWLRTGQIRPNVRLDEWQIMPNHFHAIIWIMCQLDAAQNEKSGIDCINTENIITQNDHCGIDAINTENIITQNDHCGIDAINTDGENQNEFILNKQIEELRGDLYVPFHKYGPQSNNLFAIVRGFKGAVTSRANISNIWQSRFHDRIIRNEQALTNIRAYIKNNVANWQRDIENKNFMKIIVEQRRNFEYSR